MSFFTKFFDNFLRNLFYDDLTFMSPSEFWANDLDTLKLLLQSQDNINYYYGREISPRQPQKQVQLFFTLPLSRLMVLKKFIVDTYGYEKNYPYEVNNKDETDLTKAHNDNINSLIKKSEKKVGELDQVAKHTHLIILFAIDNMSEIKLEYDFLNFARIHGIIVDSDSPFYLFLAEFYKRKFISSDIFSFKELFSLFSSNSIFMEFTHLVADFDENVKEAIHITNENIDEKILFERGFSIFHGIISQLSTRNKNSFEECRSYWINEWLGDEKKSSLLSYDEKEKLIYYKNYLNGFNKENYKFNHFIDKVNRTPFYQHGIWFSSMRVFLFIFYFNKKKQQVKKETLKFYFSVDFGKRYWRFSSISASKNNGFRPVKYCNDANDFNKQLEYFKFFFKEDNSYDFSVDFLSLGDLACRTLLTNSSQCTIYTFIDEFIGILNDWKVLASSNSLILKINQVDFSEIELNDSNEIFSLEIPISISSFSSNSSFSKVSTIMYKGYYCPRLSVSVSILILDSFLENDVHANIKLLSIHESRFNLNEIEAYAKLLAFSGSSQLTFEIDETTLQNTVIEIIPNFTKKCLEILELSPNNQVTITLLTSIIEKYKLNVFDILPAEMMRELIFEMPLNRINHYLQKYKFYDRELIRGILSKNNNLIEELIEIIIELNLVEDIGKNFKSCFRYIKSDSTYKLFRNYHFPPTVNGFFSNDHVLFFETLSRNALLDFELVRLYFLIFDATLIRKHWYSIHYFHRQFFNSFEILNHIAQNGCLDILDEQTIDILKGSKEIYVMFENKKVSPHFYLRHIVNSDIDAAIQVINSSSVEIALSLLSEFLKLTNETNLTTLEKISPEILVTLYFKNINNYYNIFSWDFFNDNRKLTTAFCEILGKLIGKRIETNLHNIEDNIVTYFQHILSRRFKEINLSVSMNSAMNSKVFEINFNSFDSTYCQFDFEYKIFAFWCQDFIFQVPKEININNQYVYRVFLIFRLVDKSSFEIDTILFDDEYKLSTLLSENANYSIHDKRLNKVRISIPPTNYTS
jgi:hypothetical protein